MGLEGGTVIAALPRDLARNVLEQAGRKIEDSIDRMKTESGDLPLVAVGGGRLSRARSGRRNLAGDPRAARRLRQCGGCRDRADQRRRPTRSIATSAAPRQSRPPKRKRGSARSPAAQPLLDIISGFAFELAEHAK